MFLKASYETKGRVAKVADKRFLAIVNAHVCSQTGAPCKHFVTDVTCEWSDSRMTPFVSVKCTNTTECQ